MVKYRFSVDGTLVSVYPLRSDPYDREEVLAELRDGEFAVILSPDGDADFYVTSFNKNNIEPREPAFVLAALFCYFKTVCGYPKMTLDVKCREKMHELSLTDDNVIISVNVGKSKILCAKTIKFADGIEIKALMTRDENATVAVVCNDSALFDERRLRLLLSAYLDKGARSAIAVSVADGFKIKSIGNAFFYEAITAGVAALSAEGIRLSDGECSCLIDGESFAFFKDKENLVFYPNVKYLY